MENVARLLVVLAADDVLWTVYLIRRAKREQMLNENAMRYQVAFSILFTCVAWGVALLAIAFLTGAKLGDFGTAMLVGALMAISLPQPVWGILDLLKRFR